MTTYKNLTVLFDGAIRLYQDDDLKGEVWQCRLRLPGVKAPYIRSTKTTNYDEARRFAEKLFHEKCYELERGIPIGEKSFEAVHKLFMKDREESLSVHRRKLHKGTADRYFIPFFGDRSIKSIDEGVIQDYWVWRISYWKSGPGKDKKAPNAALVPAQKTLDMERSMLNQVFKYAKTKKFIAQLPLLDRWEQGGAKKAKVIVRRPAFNPEEMEKLIGFMETWANEGPTIRHCRQRQSIQAMILFFYYSGLRPNELFQLRWCDVRPREPREQWDASEPTDGWIISVPETTKTGFRKAFGLANLEKALTLSAKAQGISGLPLASEALIFPNEDGEPRKWWEKTIPGVFEKAGLLLNSYRQKRTTYSLRHTFITERLLNGVDVYRLAQACGTDVTYIRRHYDHTETEVHLDELIKMKAKKDKPLPPPNIPQDHSPNFNHMFDDVDDAETAEEADEVVST